MCEQNVLFARRDVRLTYLHLLSGKGGKPTVGTILGESLMQWLKDFRITALDSNPSSVLVRLWVFYLSSPSISFIVHKVPTS